MPAAFAGTAQRHYFRKTLKPKHKPAKSATPSKHRKAGPRVAFLGIPHAGFFVLGMLLVLFGQWVTASLSSKDQALAPVSPSKAAARRVFEYSTVHLQVPEGFIPEGSQPLKSSRWSFPGITKEALLGFFSKCDLTEDQRKFLDQPYNWEISDKKIVINVPHSIMLGL
ncbi:MAG TPA: hypothetical protein VGE41_13530, partial [Verrucomicrobiae bacterium]